MKVIPINNDGAGIRKDLATGVRIYAGPRFLAEAGMQSQASAEDGCIEAQEIFDAKPFATRYPPSQKVDYSIDLSLDAARYLLGSLGDYASIWGNWGFEGAGMVRSALALEGHLTRYGLTPKYFDGIRRN
jgi:hypothetical protein